MFAFLERLSSQPVVRRGRLSLSDLAIAILLAVAAVLVARWASDQLGTSLQSARSFDLWFQADTPRVIANLTDASSNQYRVTVHPLAPALLTSVVLGLHGLGMDTALAARFVMFLIGGLSVGLFFVFLRLLDLPRSASITFTLLLVSSAAFLHWSPVEELNVPSLLTIVLALTALAYGKTGNALWWVLVNCATMGITISNWSIGLLATFVRWPLRRSLVIAWAALVIVSALGLVQQFVLPTAHPFILGGIRDELQWVQPAAEKDGMASWSPIDRLRSMSVSTIVAPTPVIEVQAGARVVTNQKAGFFDRTPAGIAAAFAWLVVFCVGVWGGVRAASLRPVAMALGLMLFSQALLHSVYGDPTFLYAPHFLPMLVAVAALSWFTPVRWIALGLVLAVTILGGANNLMQFQVAANLAGRVISEGGNKPSIHYPAKGALLP